MTNDSPPAKRSRTRSASVALVLILAGAGVLCWQMFSKDKPAPPAQVSEPSNPKAPDMAGAIQANLRGVGRMERYDFEEAIDCFEEAVAAAPDWIPAQINLGIALFRFSSPETLSRATGVFEAVLQHEPENAHAHYSLGLIAQHLGRVDDAFPHFEAVSRLVPSDAHTWLLVGWTHPSGRDSAKAKVCYERALQLDPYLNAARFRLAQNLEIDADQKKRLLSEFALLVDANATTDFEWASYKEMGPYAELIVPTFDLIPPEVGPLPKFEKWHGFRASLAPGTTWAKTGDFVDLNKAIRQRFGATVVFLDFNKDGRPDIFLPSAVMRNNKLGDLLLRNDGDGAFTDVTAEAGLTSAASWGCAVADYDNDGFPDMLLTGDGPPRLFRNLFRPNLTKFLLHLIGLGPPHPYSDIASGKFTDVSMEAGLNKQMGVFLSATWVDLDQDGRLDLILARFAESPQAALSKLQGKGNARGELVVLLNDGESATVPLRVPLPPLSTKFSAFSFKESLKLEGAMVGAVVGDFDNDRDADVLILADGQPPTGIWNNRALRFAPAGTIGQAADWNGAVLLDVNHNHCSDLLVLPTDKPPVLWTNNGGKGSRDRLADGFSRGTVDSPILRQAQPADIDMDSWTDVVGLSNDGLPVLLHNNGTNKLVQYPEAFGPNAKALGIGVADLDGDGTPDLLLVTVEGLEVRRNLGNGNRAIHLDLIGRPERSKGSTLRSNVDGIGSRVMVQTATLHCGIAVPAAQAGLGRSRLPLELGIGKSMQADLVRVRWPDGWRQNEINVPSGGIFRLEERNARRPW